MKFPQFKIVDRIINNTKNDDSRELLVVQLDWTEIDNHKIDSKMGWYQKFGIPGATQEQKLALGQLLSEVDWSIDFLYPQKYRYIFDKYSKFQITKAYYNECQHLQKMAISEWTRSRPFDTNVRESLLEASQKFVELFFYMIVDAIYIYNPDIHQTHIPPQLPNGDIRDDQYFEHSVLLKSLMLYRFWKFQTGGGLLLDKASNFVKGYNDSIRDRFEEVKIDLVNNIKFEPLGLSEWYPEKEEELLQRVNQKVRENRLKNILQ